MANPGNQATQIFISYRRGDSADVTGRIYDRLVQRFGKETIFKDVDSIPLGVNFRKHIDSMVEQCAVLLVVIGERWNTGVDETGKRRLDDARDFVRIEIESALQRDIPVIPVFVQDALMPAEESLPPSVQELTYRNGITIGHDPHFHIDVDRLIKQLESYFKRSVTEHKLEQTGGSDPDASSISSHAPSRPSSVQMMLARTSAHRT